MASLTLKLLRICRSTKVKLLCMGLCATSCVLCFIFEFHLKCQTTIIQGSSCRKEINIIKKYLTASPIQRNDKINSMSLIEKVFLVIFVISAPSNADRRQIIRLTWALKLPKDVKLFFVVCEKHLPNITKYLLKEERKYNKDMIIIPNLVDEYKQLTMKVIASMKWINENIEFDYVLKADDDTFVRVDIMVNKLRSKPKERLYWGQFSHGSKIVKSGNWAEKRAYICDTYVSYALGGGYVLSKDLVAYIVDNSDKLKKFTNEDVSVGTWLAPLDVNAVHENDFRMSGDCDERFFLIHYSTIGDMKRFNDSLALNNTLCGENVKQAWELAGKRNH